jgi:iron(III) transport system permease protein
MKRSLRILTVLPIITPPFVIGLAVILLFGRAGAVTQFLELTFDIPASRWIYGLPGVWFAQTLAFAPISFLVMIGVVEGVSPSMEEAALTLRADAWKAFTTVSLPLMRPGIANAFLLGFIESLADFGNPLVLGGRYSVLSTEIFFAIVGSQYDQGRAAMLALILLAFTLGAFYAQRRWVGKKSYTTVTGKGDSGLFAPLPKLVRWGAYGLALPWAGLTAVIYVMIMFGGFVQTWGRDHSFTLRHYIDAFAVTRGDFGLVWSGAAWNSFWTTLTIATIAAPLTATLGLLTAYLLARQRFAGRNSFEFGTMLSFAIPGTVIGISYILAFNVPPIELTGTGIILVICFVFRNMPVGVRAGVAAMSQLDQSLDEASLTLGANTFTTVRRVILPLLRPAIIAALVFSFVRAITAISAVIFLVSANYDMATSYIIGRVENGDYGLAIAYSSVLILVMMAAITVVQLVVGERHLRRRRQNEHNPVAVAGEAVP